MEAALSQCKATQAAEVDVTDELIANMVARFEAFGVTKELIERRIQRPPVRHYARNGRLTA